MKLQYLHGPRSHKVGVFQTSGTESVHMGKLTKDGDTYSPNDTLIETMGGLLEKTRGWTMTQDVRLPLIAWQQLLDPL